MKQIYRLPVATLIFAAVTPAAATGSTRTAPNSGFRPLGGHNGPTNE